MESASYRLEDLKSGVVKVSDDAKGSVVQLAYVLFTGLSRPGSLMVPILRFVLHFMFYKLSISICNIRIILKVPQQ